MCMRGRKAGARRGCGARYMLRGAGGGWGCGARRGCCAKAAFYSDGQPFWQLRLHLALSINAWCAIIPWVVLILIPFEFEVVILRALCSCQGWCRARA